MDYKEKYQEALERAKKGLPLDEVFPELKESEDERIRSFLYEFIKVCGWSEKQYPPREKCLAYIEKQKEAQPGDEDRYMEGYMNGINDALKRAEPAEWSEEDELMRTTVIQTLEEFGGRGTTGMQINWLKCLPERFNLLPKQEWSEEDVEVLETTIAIIEKNIKKGSQITTRATPSGIINREDLIKKLKSLKNRGNSPKSSTNSPSEWSEEDEEMKARVIRRYTDYEDVIMRTKEESIAAKMLNAMMQEEAWLHKSLRPQPKQDIFPSLREKEIICLKRALDYLRKEHNRYVGKDFTNEIVVLEWLITHPVLAQPYWKPSEEQIGALNYAYCELFKRGDVGHNILGPFQSLIDTLRKL